MGYQISRAAADAFFGRLQSQFCIYAPRVYERDGCFSDTDVIRYGEVHSLDEIEWNHRSDYSFKEILFPVRETLFYFTEEETSVPSGNEKKLLIFLRSCDLYALKRLDAIYLQNGPEDFYYRRRRDNARFVLMGCPENCGTGFCVSMGTSRAEDYDLYLKITQDSVLADCPNGELEAILLAQGNAEQLHVVPDSPASNPEKVTLPANLSVSSFSSPLWEEYGNRCIGCGRCNFVCPTCTCFTMQDIHYQDNGKVGERRRVWASCQVDGFTDIAGGGSFRKKQSERMRFKVMHKIYDFQKRFGYPMCVGCGRCDSVCPEYISYVNLINRLEKEEA